MQKTRSLHLTTYQAKVIYAALQYFNEGQTQAISSCKLDGDNTTALLSVLMQNETVRDMQEELIYRFGIIINE